MSTVHDDLCPNKGLPTPCGACALIAKAREDERKHRMMPGFDMGYALALTDAETALQEIRGKWTFGPRIYKHEALHAVRQLRGGLR